MATAISSGIEITVETAFQQEQSERLGAFVYAYRITLTNHNRFPVQLQSRKWLINHGNGHTAKVSGEGVVGRKPLLHPGETYQYVSGTQMESPIGRMSGAYEFVKTESGEVFWVEIPSFDLIAPVINN